MGIFGGKTTEDSQKQTSAKDESAGSAVSMKELYGNEEAAAAKSDTKGKKAVKRANAYKILLKPVVTEKATVSGIDNKYVFAVNVDSNKIEIAKAIEEVYGVKPTAVNIVAMKGKNKKMGRIAGKRKDWKKAVITLPKGKTIQVYEGV